ncbi:MAG: ATP-binding protein [Sulfurovaceae bacterium]|nr:ATP-binding protein [Sulfurovaceae bacterium]
MFKKNSITSTYIWGLVIMFFFVLLFIVLLIYEEYNDFDREAQMFRKSYVTQHRQVIENNDKRVVDFISYEYAQKNKYISKELLQKEVLQSIWQLYVQKDTGETLFVYDRSKKKFIMIWRNEEQSQHKMLFDTTFLNKLINNTNSKGLSADYNSSSQELPALVYTKEFIPWGWIVGVKVSTQIIETEIAQKKAELKKRLIKLMMEILSLGVILFGFALIWAWIVHYIITKQVSTFREFFSKASQKHILIDENEMMLTEFKSMVGYVNSMVDEIHKRKNRLQDMNALLEKKVEQKTHDLYEKNLLLEQANLYSQSLIKAQDSFIKHSIHEVNTPLSVILIHLDIYKMKYGINDYMSKIEAATKMIATIYDDLTYMVKKDRIEYNKEWLNMSDFLRARISFFYEIASGNKHKILQDIKDEMMIYFNTLELQRLIDNNISNAIKYAKKDSDIIIKLYEHEKQIVLEFITVTKNKIEDVEKIFYPFHREDSTQIGLGLGLEIVRLICDRENINISVRSTDKETSFKYIFDNNRNSG